mgnify:CR=1 FL=1
MLKLWYVALILLSFNSYVYASDNNVPSLPEVNFTSYFITLFVLLALVVALGYLSASLKNRGSLPKLNLPFGGIIKPNRHIKVVEKYVLEPRKTLYIINVASRNWVIASSEANLQIISEVNIEGDNSVEQNMNSKDKIDITKKDKDSKGFSDYLNLPVMLLVFLFISLFFISPSFAAQSDPSGFMDQIDLRAPMKLKELGTPLQLIIFMAFLTLLPFFFIMTTSFMRTIIVLGFLRQAIGTQQVPPNQVIMGISIFLTIYIMTPVWQEVNDRALSPYLNNKISQSVALERGVPPIRNFMLKYTKKEELSFFMRVVKLPQPKTAEDVPIHVLIPAYMVSELSTGFKIGFFLFLPFLVVDLVVANTLLALGMMMLSPVTISMPFKLLVFTLANGWYLVLQALVTSFKL